MATKDPISEAIRDTSKMTEKAFQEAVKKGRITNLAEAQQWMQDYSAGVQEIAK